MSSSALTSGSVAHVPIDVFPYCHAFRAENRADTVRGIIRMLEVASLSHLFRPLASHCINGRVTSQRGNAVLGTSGINASMDVSFFLGSGLFARSGSAIGLLRLLGGLSRLSWLSRLRLPGAAGNHVHDLRTPDTAAQENGRNRVILHVAGSDIHSWVRCGGG